MIGNASVDEDVETAVSKKRTTWSVLALAFAAAACSHASESPRPAATSVATPSQQEEAGESLCDVARVRQAAENALTEAEAPGTVVVLDLASGDPLAVARTEPASIAAPPGSTVKPLLALAGLKHEVIAADETIPCDGTWSRDGATLTCVAEHGAPDMRMALATSCNVYFYELTARIGPRPIADELEALGLESLAASLRDAASDGLGFIATAIGHSDARVEPSALARAYRHLLISSEIELQPIRAGMLAAVQADEGTAGKAAVPGLDVAGKTGTAEATVDDVEHTHAWFVGYAPADDPQVLVTVHVDGQGTGGAVAAPVAAIVLGSWRETCGGSP